MCVCSSALHLAGVTCHCHRQVLPLLAHLFPAGPRAWSDALFLHFLREAFQVLRPPLRASMRTCVWPMHRLHASIFFNNSARCPTVSFDTLPPARTSTAQSSATNRSIDVFPMSSGIFHTGSCDLSWRPGRRV